MMVHGTLKYNTPIILEGNQLSELAEDLFSKYCTHITYIGTTVKRVDIVFSSLDDLLQYKNWDDDRLIALTMIGFNNKRKVLHITFGWLHEIRRGLKYPDVLVCKYYVPTVEWETSLKNDIENFLKTSKVPHPKLDKNAHIILPGVSYPIAAFVIHNLFSCLGIRIQELWIFLSLWLLLSVLVYWSMRGLSHIVEYLFPPIVFLWKEENKRDKQRTDLREKLFWGVLIGGLVNVFFPLLFNHLTV